jgi:hypothetical protein
MPSKRPGIGPKLVSACCGSPGAFPGMVPSELRVMEPLAL